MEKVAIWESRKFYFVFVIKNKHVLAAGQNISQLEDK